MGKRAKLIVSALGILLGAGGCVVSCEADTVPDPLTCTNAPSTAEIEEVAIATGPRDPAVPLEDGDPTYAIVGTQGALMISLRAMWRGAAPPACGKVQFRVRRPDTHEELHGESADLLSAPSRGFRVSGEVFFVVESWPGMVDVEVEVYGATVTRRLLVGGYLLDGGPGELPDAGSDGGDAGGPPDGGDAADAGSDPTSDGGSDPTPDGGSDPTPDGGSDPTSDAGSTPTPDAGAAPDAGSDGGGL